MSWPAQDAVPDKGFLHFFRASSLLSEMKAFSASIINMALQANFDVLREKLFFFTMT